MSYARNRTLLDNARSLRKSMTKEERHLWYDFLRYCRPRFRRQEIVSNYIIDFFCHDAKIAIELDGSQHYEPEHMERDAVRDEYFRGMGCTVLRYSNADVNYRFRGVCEDIWNHLFTKSSNPPNLIQK